MSLPKSSSIRICGSCYEEIAIGDDYGHDPDGNVACKDCLPSESLEQYEDYDFGTDVWYDECAGDYEEWDE